jgi:hydroxyacylglutathione hydrolase
MYGFVRELEDELGDVLEKALKFSGMTEESLACRSGVCAAKIKDAEDYRYDLTADELRSLANVLKLNEVGLSALSGGRYPLPALSGLPCELHTLAMPFGVGCVNAYLVAEPGAGTALLFDTGNDLRALSQVWPEGVDSVDGIFLTHWDADHAGGVDALRRRYPEAVVFAPAGGTGSFKVLSGGETIERSGFNIRVMDTPGHSEHHLSYHVVPSCRPESGGILVGGDLLFAGSVACAFYCPRKLLTNVRRVLAEMDGETVVAPGHGPLTTIENERRYNVFNF